MVSIIKGISKKFVSSGKLYDFFGLNNDLNGVFYIGYPILFSTIESITIDALWISKEYGIVVFDLVENGIIDIDFRLDLQDDLNIRLRNLLTQYPELRKRTDSLVPINVITYSPDSPKVEDDELQIATTDAELLEYIDNLTQWKDGELFDKALSVIQSVTKLKDSNKRSYVLKIDSKGSKLKKLEDTIASLDNYQEKAIVEYFGGIQRIRGLAGSGKTIILALKAAYLYSQYPDWKIAVTFNTRSLKKQFKDLIERFVVEKKGELPN